MRYSDWLRGIGTGAIAPDNHLYGLCWNFSEAFPGCGLSGEMYLCDIAWEDWPEFSGDATYPVSGIDAYEAGGRNGNQYVGEDGAKRKRLALWLANKFEEKGL